MQSAVVSPTTRLPYAATGRRRLAILAVFLAVAIVFAALRVMPPEVPVLLLLWISAVAVATRLIARAPTISVAETIETISFALDTVVLTAVCYFLGGGTWLAATFYVFLVIVASASLRWIGALIVATLAWAAFAFLVLGEAAGLLEPRPFGPGGDLTGDVANAWIAFVVTGVTIVLAVFLQQTLVGSLRRSEAEQRLLLEASTDVIVTLDQEGTILTLGEAGAKELGTTAEDLTGRSFEELVATRHRDRWRRQLAMATSGARVQVEAQYVRGDGEDGWIAGTIMPLGEDGAERFLFVGRDITDEKLMNAAQDVHRKEITESLQRQKLEQWVRDITRQIEQSLVAIRGSAESMIEEGRADREADAFRDITRDAARAAALVRDLAARTTEEKRSESGGSTTGPQA